MAGIQARMGCNNSQGVRPENAKIGELGYYLANPCLKGSAGRTAFAKSFGIDNRSFYTGSRTLLKLAGNILGRSTEQGEVGGMGKACQIRKGRDAVDCFANWVHGIDNTREVAANEVTQDDRSGAERLIVNTQKNDPVRPKDFV